MQAGRTKPIDGLPRYIKGKPCPQRDISGNVESLLGLGGRAAHNQVVNFGGVELGHPFNDGFHHLGGIFDRRSFTQRAAWRFANGTAAVGDDNCFSHDFSP